MSNFPEGNAIVYCQGAFNTTNGKTAHGLVRHTQRYHVLAVIDSSYAGSDAGLILDGTAKNIPIFSTVAEAVQAKQTATHLVIGLSPDGGRLSAVARRDVLDAIEYGLQIDSGLHDFLSEDPGIMELASRKGVQVRDIRMPPHRNQLHFFTGKIEEVTSLKIAVLGTDSALGKRTTAWQLVRGLRDSGYLAELIGTGQTAWMQGVSYGIVMDSLVNDFLTGEIEHAIWNCWDDSRPDAIVIEGQGSLMNPAYPGGYEILAAGRPEIVVLQHAPARREYDGFPGYPIQPLPHQIEAIEVISTTRVVAVAVNHENLPLDTVNAVCETITCETGLPATDVLLSGPEELVETVLPYLREHLSSRVEKL